MQFSRTLNPASGCTIWCARAIPWRATMLGALPVISAPSNLMRPELGVVTPLIRLKTVDFPAPFGPIRPRSSPALRLKLRPPTASTPPKRLLKSMTSSSAVIPATVV